MHAVDEIELEDVLDEALEEEIKADADEPTEVGGEAGIDAETVEEESEDAAEPDPSFHPDPDEVLTEEPAPGPEALPANTVTIAAIDGVPLFYERLPSGAAPRRFTIARSYLPIVEQTVKEVKARVPAAFGPLQRISSAGTFVNKPGMHGLARAVDWDRWTFKNLGIAPIKHEHASPSKAVRRRYWALAAICRANSSFVLHGRYNREHEDHIHQDNGSSVRFAEMESTVKLCQAVLNDIFGGSLAIDGHFGGETRTALERAMRKVQLDGNFQDVASWRRFLRRSGRVGFRLSVG
jgi:hypothetical protein